MRKLLFNLHLYFALIVGIFVVIIGVTGSIMAFEPELDRLMNPALFRVAPQGQTLPVSEIFQAASRAYPGQKIGFIRMPQSPDDSAQFNIKGPKQVFLNPYTGAILGERSPATPLSTIHSIHLRLLMGPPGGNIVAIATGVLLFLVLSGIYLWWPLKRASVKFDAGIRRFHFDLHNTAGIYSAAFLLVLGATGIVVHFDDSIEQSLHHRAGTHKIAKNVASSGPKGAAPVTVDQAVQIALNAIPGTQTLAISLPANPKASYVIALHFPEDLTPGGRSWVNVDQYDGKVLSEQNSRTVAAGTRTIIWNRAIHTGDVYGLLTKTLMSLSSMMLVIQAITGYYMWWKKLRARQRRTDLAAEATLA
ncbi:MAG: PepSY domain-containing protein [Acidobacteriia bacterium]|nr:PepSY domain-containing protein [Terriglobia bacterium]